MRVLALFFACLWLAAPASAALIPEQVPPAKPRLQFLEEIPKGYFIFLEASTMGRVRDKGFVWQYILTPKPGQYVQGILVRTIIDCKTSVMQREWVAYVDRNGAVLDDEADGSTTRIELPFETTMARAACSGKPLAIGAELDWKGAFRKAGGR